MPDLAARLDSIRPSPTLSLAAQARKARSDGKDVIELGGGDPDFDSPPHIVEAAVRALHRGWTHYGPSQGDPALTGAIACKLSEENNVNYDADSEILVTPGAKQGILYALLALLDPGDEVLIPEPSWVSYPDMVSIVGAVPVMVSTRTETGFRLNIEKLDQSVSARTKVIMICNPNNPTGSVLTENELHDLQELAEDHDLWILSDEVYEKIVFDGCEFLSTAAVPGMKERTVTINGFSKTYAMTGWRIAYMGAPAQLIERALKVQQQSATCVSAFAQRGALAALTGSQECVHEMVEIYAGRRVQMSQLLKSMDFDGVLCPQGTFYMFPDVSMVGTDGEECAKFLLNEASVTSVPGTAFGPSGSKHIRLSFALTGERMGSGLRRMQRALCGKQQLTKPVSF